MLDQELVSQHADFSVVVSKLFQATITTKGFDDAKAEAFVVSDLLQMLSCFDSGHLWFFPVSTVDLLWVENY